jgi:two-component system CheB/CheR fusion protein
MQTPRAHLCILVVDDCPDTTSSLVALMTIWGHRVLSAQGGREALALAAQHRPDVVLLDIAMPGMTGWDLASKLRALPGLERVVLLAVSGYGGDGDRRRSLEAGCALHMIKPVDPADLKQLLTAIETREPKVAAQG